MSKKVIGVLFLSLCLFVAMNWSNSVLAVGYNYHWTLQKRTAEGEGEGYIIVIYIFPFVDKNIIKAVTLKGPNGFVTVPDLPYSTMDTLPMSFDAINGVWSYGSDFDVYSYHWGYFDGPYEFGSYTITITDIYDEVFVETKTFSAQPNLPKITSDSFRGEISSSGDLVWQWQPISDADFWASGLDSMLRVWVYAKEGDTMVADAFGQVPLNAGMMYVPKAVLDKLRLKGSTLGVGLQIKNNDGLTHHRYYSKRIPLSDLAGLSKRNSSGFFVIPIKVQ